MLVLTDLSGPHARRRHRPAKDPFIPELPRNRGLSRGPANGIDHPRDAALAGFVRLRRLDRKHVCLPAAVGKAVEVLPRGRVAIEDRCEVGGNRDLAGGRVEFQLDTDLVTALDLRGRAVLGADADHELPALAGRGLLRLSDPLTAASHFAYLVLSIPQERAMFCTGDQFTAAELDQFADAGVRVFLAAYRA